MTDFTGRGVLVTGGALGIGRGIAGGFATAGAHVTIADVDSAAAAAAVDEIRRHGGLATATIGDVADARDAERMVTDAFEFAGRLDVLVNNAGIQPRQLFLPVDEVSEQTWDRVLAVNLKGPFLMTRHAIPRFRAAGGGVVINIASVQGLQSQSNVAAYAASKGGLLSLTRAMALDHAHEGIRVVAINPGTIDTNMVRAPVRDDRGDMDATLQRYARRHPVGRIGSPDDIAQAALFLASPGAGFITGEWLNVDGGLMAVGAWSTDPA